MGLAQKLSKTIILKAENHKIERKWWKSGEKQITSLPDSSGVGDPTSIRFEKFSREMVIGCNDVKFP